MARKDAEEGEEIELLVFSDDWGRHSSSSQHLIGHLLPRYSVCWVNTIGTRRPSLSPYSIRRGAEKVRDWTRFRAAPEVANPRVLNPIMWPSYRSRVGRYLNRWLLAAAVRSGTSKGARRIVITTIPVVVDLVGFLPAERWIYYCVDDLSRWPGLDKVSLESLERTLVMRVDSVIAASESLADRISALGHAASLLTHGVDLGHWTNPRDERLSRLERLSRPLVVFWGLIDRRLEVRWLRDLNDKLHGGSIVLVGPTNEHDPMLDSMERVSRIGPVPYSLLPTLAEFASVLIMPYADLPTTQMMQPLKLKEYLATSKPCVVARLPAVEEWRDACDVVSSAEDFCRLVLERLETGLPEDQAAARQRLMNESWERKAREFERLILGQPL